MSRKGVPSTALLELTMRTMPPCSTTKRRPDPSPACVTRIGWLKVYEPPRREKPMFTPPGT
jgi:hypothetical protein